MWLRPRSALALLTVLASASAAQAGPVPVHHGALPATQAQGPGASLQLPLGHAQLRVSQPMQPIHPLTSPQHKTTEQQPSTVPGYNPLKRRHMAMPVLPGEDGSELAF